LVLAWGVAPPAIRHGHEGGEDAEHRHEHEAASQHGHHDGGHAGDEDLPTAGVVVSLTPLRSLVVHLHWNFLGVGFSVPVSQDDQPDGGDDHARPEMVRLVDSVPTPVVAGGDRVSNPLATAAQRRSDRPVFATLPTHRSQPAQTAPLCDRARHERSGVLVV
jgi:hypothetical protein